MKTDERTAQGSEGSQGSDATFEPSIDSTIAERKEKTAPEDLGRRDEDKRSEVAVTLLVRVSGAIGKTLAAHR
jgi:hypothetical protein